MKPTSRLRPWSALAAAGAGCVLASAALAQPPAEAPAGMLPVPRVAEPEAEPAVAPITLPAALQLAQAANLDIAQSRELVSAAQAALLRARVQVLPSVNIGSTYTEHEGQIQKTEGNIITANKQALFVGGGPSLVFQTADALFGPEIARQLALATDAGARRVNNDALLAVADAYLNVLRARRRLARADEILNDLTSEEPAPQRGGSKGLLPLVRAYVEAHSKEVLPSDLARVEVEVMRRRDERLAAVQDLRVAGAELARLLRLDPAVMLWPLEDFRRPVPLPAPAWADRPTEDLVAVALGNRPELAESRALVEAAVARVKAARVRPLVPNVALNYNWGDFGGGPDPNPSIVVPPTKPGGPVKVVTQPGFGPDDKISHFKTRSDFDVSLVWRLQNMGFGNRAEVREQEALRRQASLRELQVRDRVVAQVVQADEQVREGRRRVGVTRAALFDDDGRPAGPAYRSLRLNFTLILQSERRPLEVVDSIRGLGDMLEAYVTDVTEYERAWFRLLVGLGLPPAALTDFKTVPGQ